MPSRGRSSFLILALAGAAFVALTLPRLPEPMAVHFGLRGDPDGWASHGVYVATIAIIGLVLPIAIVPWYRGWRPPGPRRSTSPARTTGFSLHDAPKGSAA